MWQDGVGVAGRLAAPLTGTGAKTGAGAVAGAVAVAAPIGVIFDNCDFFKGAVDSAGGRGAMCGMAIRNSK